MIFNLTLLLQMLHFAIAYLLLRKFLFLPVLTLLDKEKAHQNAIDQMILELEEHIVLTKKQQHKQIELLQAHFLSHKPAHILSELSHEQEGEYTKSQSLLSISTMDRYLFSEQLKKVLQQKLQL